MLGPPRPLAFAVWLVLTLRVAFGIVGALTLALDPRPLMRGIAAWTELDVRHPGLIGLVLSPWQRWDALWYQVIVERGYSTIDGRLWFFPLYPVVSRVASALLLGETMLAMIVVSTLAFGAAAFLLYRLAALDAGPGTARLTVLLLALFPTGFFLLAPYTESLFLALSVATFLALRSGRAWVAGLAALGAGLTRAPGALLLIPLALHAIRRVRERRRIDRDVVAVLLPLVGPLAYDLYATTQGLEGSLLSLQKLWGVRNVPPWEALGDSVAHVMRTGDANELLNLAALAFAVAMLILWRRMPLDLLLYSLASLFLLVTRDLDNLSPLLGMSRYVLVLFPCFMALARALRSRPRLAASVLVTSLVMEVALFSYWVRWGFVA